MSNYNEDESHNYYLDVNEILNEPAASQAQHDYQRQLEYEITSARTYQLERNPIQGKYDLEHLSKIHEYLFRGLYDYAGKVRTDELAKRIVAPDQATIELGHFQYCNCIRSDFASFSQEIHKSNFLKDLDYDEFLEKFTDLYAKLNEIHPFEEGNGRSSKLMMQQLANEAGYFIDYSNVDADEWNYACKRSLSAQEIYIDDALTETIKQPQDKRFLEFVMHTILKPLEHDYRLNLKKEKTKDSSNDFNY